jgi:hypothetical protein
MDFGEPMPLELPAARDDEPDCLRQDIADELADHLACGARREMLRGTDPTKVWRAVTERFGDPGAVARRLWQDAMKERIMAQRVLIATCLFVTAASLALVGIFWMQSTRAANELAETNRRMVETLTENQATNREVLKQLQGLAKSVKAPQASEWIPVSFKLTQERFDGPPAVGCRVNLEGKTSMTRISDANGIVDFGVVRPGDFSFRIFETCDEAGDFWQTDGTVNAVPGSKVSKSVICPKTPSDGIPVRMAFDWPSDLADKDLHVKAYFEHRGVIFEGTLTWLYHSTRLASLVQRDFICGPKSKVESITDDDSFHLWRTVSERGNSPVYAELEAKRTKSSSEFVELERGSFQLQSLIVMRPCRIAEAPVRATRFEVLAHLSPNGKSPPAVVYREMQSPTDSGLHLPTIAGVGDERLEDGVAAPTFWKQMRQRFEVRPDQKNEWKIPIPDELAQAVREALKKDGSPKPAPAE